MDYGAALEMRFGATRRGFESRPLRHYARRLAADSRGHETGREAAPDRLVSAVLGGELAVPCTCNPLQQG